MILMRNHDKTSYNQIKGLIKLKKTILFILGLCLMLTGCREIPGPGELFEAALMDIEERTAMTTRLELSDEREQKLVQMTIDSQNLDTDPQIRITKEGVTDTVLEDDLLARLGRFDLLADVFSEFSYEKEDDRTTIMFTIPTSEVSLLAEALSPWITESFNVIRGEMVINHDGVIQSCDLNITTANHDYDLEIDMLKLV